MNLLNRTKIIATIGPASSSVDVLQEIIKAGCTIFRINFSHGEYNTHENSIKSIRQAAKSLGQHVAILGDLQGPKIRIGSIVSDRFDLEKGQELILDSDIGDQDGSIDGVSYHCDTLAQACSPGRELVLDDGKVQLEVVSVDGNRIVTKVIAGSSLSSRKGLNLKGGGLAEKALTEKDRRDMAFAKSQNLDYLCVSFPASPEDMLDARRILSEIDYPAKLIAKVERAELVQSDQTIDDIINHSDGVMVARGDLAIEVGFEKVTSLQKKLITRSRKLNKPVIVATQMMESMISSPVPTRAEASDVTNAIFDYADAVMLSAETAVGDYPLETVKAVQNVIVATEQNEETQVSKHRVDSTFHMVDETIAMATMYLANHYKPIKAIICLTESGSTALWLSRIKTALPLVAMSPHEKTLNRVALYRGVKSAYLPHSENRNQRLREAIKELRSVVDINDDDYVVITYGDVVGTGGLTNTLKILKVKE